MNDMYLVIIVLEVFLIVSMIGPRVIDFFKQKKIRQIEKETAKYEGTFWGVDSHGDDDPNAFVKITYDKTLGHRYWFANYSIHFMDLTRRRLGYYKIIFLPENEKYNNRNAFIVHKKVDEIWTYTKNEAGYIEEIQPLSEDCYYRLSRDNESL